MFIADKNRGIYLKRSTEWSFALAPKLTRMNVCSLDKRSSLLLESGEITANEVVQDLSQGGRNLVARVKKKKEEKATATFTKLFSS